MSWASFNVAEYVLSVRCESGGGPWESGLREEPVFAGAAVRKLRMEVLSGIEPVSR